MCIRIDDQTGKFSKQDHAELIQLVVDELLSEDWDRNLLDVIRIRNDGPQRYDGYYSVTLQYDPHSGNLESGAAVIVLNQFYLKTLASLKRTLAHEYGHHWTLSYLAVNKGITKQQLPCEYYKLREMNETHYASDYSMGWNRCDREVIAEDYRVLFAPPPHNSGHRMIISLPLPDNQVEDYIVNLKAE
jgi:hypothetical protein